MKYLVFGLEFKDKTLSKIIEDLQSKYNLNKIELFKNRTLKFEEKDFIKTGEYTYIFNNEKIIDELLKIKISNNIFYRDDIEQVLYFETNPEYIPYLKVHKLNSIQILENYDKSFIIPELNKNLVETINQKYKRTNHIYTIEFDKDQYIKDTYNTDNFIEKLNKTNNIISNYDVLIYINKQFYPKNIYENVEINGTKLYQDKINYTYLLVLCFEYEDINEVIKYLKYMVPNEFKELINKNNIIQQKAENCYLIKDQTLINTLINTDKYSLDKYTINDIQENYEFRFKDKRNKILYKLLIKVDENLVSKINIIQSCSLDIIKHIKNQNSYILPKCYNYSEIFSDLQSDSLSYENKLVIQGLQEEIHECLCLEKLNNDKINNSGISKDAILFFDYI